MLIGLFTAENALPAMDSLNGWMTQANQAPVAQAGSAFGPDTGPVDLDLRTLVTDEDTPSSQWSFTVSAPIQGTVSLLADGYTARFIPSSGSVLNPSFTYTVTDPLSGTTASASVQVGVTPKLALWTGVPAAGGTAFWSGTANWQGGLLPGSELAPFPAPFETGLNSNGAWVCGPDIRRAFGA